MLDMGVLQTYPLSRAKGIVLSTNAEGQAWKGLEPKGEQPETSVDLLSNTQKVNAPSSPGTRNQGSPKC